MGVEGEERRCGCRGRGRVAVVASSCSRCGSRCGRTLFVVVELQRSLGFFLSRMEARQELVCRCRLRDDSSQIEAPCARAKVREQPCGCCAACC